MQVVSGPTGQRKVHYEAPPAERVPEEMARYLSWFETPGNADPLITAGLAHLLFATIHPFDDGFERKLTTSKWAKLAKCSQDTGYRDILELVWRGALRKDTAGGRSTSYSLAS
jgi:Fic family protein